jgi:carbohydrate diacid regulator
VLLWLPLTRGETVVAGEQRVAGQADAVVKNCPGVTAIGVGLPAAGARGWRASADQALKAVDTGARLRSNGAVHRYSDIALNDAVAAADSVTRYFGALIERLAQEPQLLTTLETYFERHQHRKATAAALHIHPNTLNYRLERIETLLGARLDDVGWLAKLDTALRLRRASPPA